MKYLVSDYHATGEGRTICILITKAYPRLVDYKDSKLINSEEFRACREFTENFDSYYLPIAVFLDVEEFFKVYGRYVPLFLETMVHSDIGNLNYAMKFHFNFA